MKFFLAKLTLKMLKLQNQFPLTLPKSPLIRQRNIENKLFLLN